MVAISGPSSSLESSGINIASSDSPNITINGDDDTIMKEAVDQTSGESDVELSSGTSTDTETIEHSTPTPLTDEVPIL